MSLRRRQYLIGLVLVGLTVAAYAEVRHHDFVNFDDELYITENPQVRDGLSRPGLRWAWTTFHAANWHPLTWMSLQLDAQLYGPWAGGYHLTNLFWHTASVALLYAVLARMTGARGRSALVAALFAVHPLHVESVAWVSERKDVLSGFFAILTLGAYGWYAQRPSAGRYLAVFGSLALGLLAKPMLVTLPCVLLLLDYWPLGRLRRGQPLPAKDLNVSEVAAPRYPVTRPVWLFLEKLPLFALVLASCVVTVVAQLDTAVVSLETIPMDVRLATALVAYAVYLVRTVWPMGLTAFYPPSQEMPPGWQVAGAAMLLGAISALAVWQGRRRPYLLVGWLWFLGMLVPVIGLLKVGVQPYADRYTYLPHIGLFVMVVWGMADLLPRRGYALTFDAGLAMILVAVLAGLTTRQVHYWRSSELLWRHALEVTPENGVAHNNLGMWFAKRARDGRAKGTKESVNHYYQEAIKHLSQAVKLIPGPLTQFNLAEVLFETEQHDQAMGEYQAVLQSDPQHENAPKSHLKLSLLHLRRHELKEAHDHATRAIQLDPSQTDGFTLLANIALREGRLEDAARHASVPLRRNPRDADGYDLLGLILDRQGNSSEAVACLRKAVELRPGAFLFRCNLAFCLYRLGDVDAARAEYRAASRLAPNWPEQFNVSAWRLATAEDRLRRDPIRALLLAQQVCQATDYERPEYLDTLAAAYAEAGQFPEAVDTARKAQVLAANAGQSNLAAKVANRLRFYEQQQPFRDSAGSSLR